MGPIYPPWVWAGLGLDQYSVVQAALCPFRALLLGACVASSLVTWPLSRQVTVSYPARKAWPSRAGEVPSWAQPASGPTKVPGRWARSSWGPQPSLATHWALLRDPAQCHVEPKNHPSNLCLKSWPRKTLWIIQTWVWSLPSWVCHSLARGLRQMLVGSLNTSFSQPEFPHTGVSGQQFLHMQCDVPRAAWLGLLGTCSVARGGPPKDAEPIVWGCLVSWRPMSQCGRSAGWHWVYGWDTSASTGVPVCPRMPVGEWQREGERAEVQGAQSSGGAARSHEAQGITAQVGHRYAPPQR